MAIRDSVRESMRDSAAPHLRHGELVHAVFAGQTASQWLAVLTSAFVFLPFNRYRIFVVTSARIVVVDAGQSSMKTALSVMAELPRSTRLGPPAGIWHTIPVGDENIRVHRHFFKDIDRADVLPAAA
ncbi:MAG: hypothetical protein ABJB47_23285 [Actinomycetota bacterium]